MPFTPPQLPRNKDEAKGEERNKGETKMNEQLHGCTALWLDCEG